jgi:hypothetical protein
MLICTFSSSDIPSCQLEDTLRKILDTVTERSRLKLPASTAFHVDCALQHQQDPST